MANKAKREWKTVKLNESEVERQQEQDIPVTDANVSNDRDQTLDSDGSDETILYRGEEEESE